ncbi:MAG TPA: arylsulfotransferase family protein [Solirubrobacteraceae bacterium]|nr:arylsulfotransferase family protein [Solirubrobacteraceae bacterium]
MFASRPLRHRSRLWLFAALIGAAIAVVLIVPWSSGSSRAAATPVNVFPIPGGRVAAPATQLTFRGLPAADLGTITVTGSKSGAHTGRVLSDSDGRGGSFIPTKAFDPGEQVTVRTGLDIVGATNGAYSFTVATPAGAIRAAAPQRAPRVGGDVDHFVSAPQLMPAALTVTRQPSHTAPGDLFVAPQAGPVQYGPEILGPYGGLIWFKTVPKNESATDFREQSYQGKPVLTWWQGTVNGGIGTGDDEIYNSSYQPVATVHAGNGLRADLHEFELTSQNTALVTAYYPVHWDASSVKHGTKGEIVLDAVAQEIDIPTGLVLYQWDSLDHVPLTASYQPAPTTGGHPYDYFHINAISQAADGSIVVSARNTWSVYDLSHQTGAINWILGGRQTTFKMGPNTAFAFQHDARLSGSQITIFDDGAGPPIVHKRSRGITLRLDTVHKTATLVLQDEHQPGLLAEYEGSIQPLSNGDALLGWGEQPFMTEFNSKGRPVFDARFVDLNSTYRAFRFAWTGTPSTKPSAAEVVKGGKATAYASWNGANTVARWRILGGSSATSLKPVAGGAHAAFETAVRLPHPETYIAAQALDAHGKVLGTSAPVKAS